MLALLLVAVSLGLSNFGASVGIGAGGSDSRTRIRVGLIFGLFETGMPIVGLLLGRDLARYLGHAAHGIGGALLIAAGLYAVVQAVRDPRGPGAEPAPAASGPGTGRLLVSGVALSIDNLAVGFGLGTYHVGIVVAAIVIGAVSVTLSLAGLELGGRLGARTGSRGELLGGVILVAVGVAIAASAL